MWWVESLEASRRPYLVLTRAAAIPLLNSYLAVPATRRVRGLPTEVEIGRRDGMPDECALTLDNTSLIPRSFFIERICRLSHARMQEVCRALCVATGC